MTAYCPPELVFKINMLLQACLFYIYVLFAKVAGPVNTPLLLYALTVEEEQEEEEGMLCHFFFLCLFCCCCTMILYLLLLFSSSSLYIYTGVFNN